MEEKSRLLEDKLETLLPLYKFATIRIAGSTKSPSSPKMTSHQTLDNESPSIVLYPSPGMGHLVSMFELGKLLVKHHSLSVTILIVEPHYNTGSTAPFISRISASSPSISFHHLPTVVPPPNPSPHYEACAFDLLRLSNPNVLNFLITSSPSALIVDMFCTYAIDIGKQLNIPTYLFFTSGANCLSFFLHFPKIHENTSMSFREMGSVKLEIPGAPSIPADHMILPMLDRDDPAYVGFLEMSRRLTEVKGFIINTVASIEKSVVDTIAAEPSFPPLWCIGPLINNSEDKEKVQGSECLSWLDKQPKQSVVFLCFGSLGLFSAEQLKEIAIGLEKSGHRFLWVVRSPPSNDPDKRFKAPPEADLDWLLPDGFLNRTKERGFVVKSWVPQVSVLLHGSVGGFVTHCGWNSILEAICGGVPMIGWPLYAEQKMNLVFLTEEMKLAVVMRGYDKEMVSAEEVEMKVRWLMESNGGKELKERMMKAKEYAVKALEDEGSSQSALTELVKELRGL